MKKNMGFVDKRTRISLAIIIAGLYYFNIISGVLGFVLLTFALVFVITSFLSFCPLYLPFGISTCKKEK